MTAGARQRGAEVAESGMVDEMRKVRIAADGKGKEQPWRRLAEHRGQQERPRCPRS